FPDFDERLAQGDTNFAWQWLRENLYEYGSTYLPDDLIARVTGEPPTTAYFADYLNAKYSEVYQLPPAE
ncbi:MAG TPA: hypothetical protein VFU88_15570, partial [Ktedonobacterales bacterium]|nr:hypothetical protein [Ktedonobacterales bacterium]